MINYTNYNLEEEIQKILKRKYSCKEFFNWYGFKKIICTIYNIKPSRFLSARIFHSIFPTDYELYYRDSIYSKNPVLCTRQSQVDFLINNGRNKKNTFATGGLFPLYRRYKNIQQSDNATGTIAFPVHTSKNCKILVSYQKYIDSLKELPDKFKPIHVCLHWRDIVNGTHKIFMENGVKVYTAGHCNDEDFCDNFYEILRHYKYATSNHKVATSLLYATEMGLNSFYYSSSEEPVLCPEANGIYGISKEKYDDYFMKYSDFYEKNIPVYPNVSTSSEQLSSIIKVMGLDENLSPKKNIQDALLKQKNKNMLTSITNIIFKNCSTWQKYQFRILGFIKLKFKRKLLEI